MDNHGNLGSLHDTWTKRGSQEWPCPWPVFGKRGPHLAANSLTAFNQDQFHMACSSTWMGFGECTSTDACLEILCYNIWISTFFTFSNHAHTQGFGKEHTLLYIGSLNSSQNMLVSLRMLLKRNYCQGYSGTGAYLITWHLLRYPFKNSSHSNILVISCYATANVASIWDESMR